LIINWYSGAVALDQIRVDRLPPASFHKEYDYGMWQLYRNHHLRFLNLLLVTVPQIPKKTLRSLTGLATKRKTSLVREAMVELLSSGSFVSVAPGYIDSAPLFFENLINDVGRGVRGDDRRNDFRERIMCWLAPIDPLSIANNPQCGYLHELQHQVQYGF
jgi:hypothetical protein